MVLYRFWAGVAGYLVIIIRGAALEKLLNLASANGIYLWDIKRFPPDLMTARIGRRGFCALRPFLRLTGCRVRIRRKRGLPFLWQRLRRRAGFLCGFVMFVAAVAVLTGFIWRVELVGVKRLDAAALRGDLRRLGLYRGVWRGRLDRDRIRAELERITPEAAWIDIDIRGVVAVVRVVERALSPAQEEPGDLVAARDGLISRLVVYRGTPVVREGDTVRQGQLLVSGREIRLDEGGGLAPRLVPASARVEARVWEQAVATLPLRIWRDEPTGRKTIAVGLNLGSMRLRVGPGRPPYRWYRWERIRRPLIHGRNSLALVEITIDRYYEVRPGLRGRTTAAAAAAAAGEARAALRGRLPGVPPDGIRLEMQAEPGWVTAIASAEVLRDIAAFERHREASGQPR